MGEEIQNFVREMKTLKRLKQKSENNKISEIEMLDRVNSRSV